MEFRQNVALLVSTYTKDADYRTAQVAGEIYCFRGGLGQQIWVRGSKACLAPWGLLNILRRLEIKVDVLFDTSLTLGTLTDYSHLLLADAGHLDASAVEVIQAWHRYGDNFLVVSGRTNLPPELLGLADMRTEIPFGYTGLCWQGSALRILKPGSFYLTGGPGYPVVMGRALPTARVLAKMYEFTGELSQPHATEKRELDGDAVVQTERTLFIGDAFLEFWAGLLQGHVWAEQVRNWYHQPVFADQMAMVFTDLLRLAGLPGPVRHKLWSKGRGLMVLRHDTDSSCDITYLKEEQNKGIAATHTILLRENRGFWLNQLAQAPEQEFAFHFSSVNDGPWIKILKCCGLSIAPRPAKNRLKRNGLLRLVRKAIRKGIPVATLHKHFGFVLYPESLEAMEVVYQKIPDVLGASILSYSIAYNYGEYVPQVASEPYGFWFPYKPILACGRMWRPASGWEIPFYQEPTPSITDFLVDHALTGLPNTVVVLNFHPVHAHRSLFGPNGNKPFFDHAISRAQKKGLYLSTCRQVFTDLNRWENVRLRFETRNILLENVGSEALLGIEVVDGSNQQRVEVLKPQQVLKLPRTRS